jgi:hypothetical protein
MAAATGASKMALHRAWSPCGLKTTTVGTFALSNDPKFSEGQADIVGPYLFTLEEAIMLCASSTHIAAWASNADSWFVRPSPGWVLLPGPAPPLRG